MLPNLVPPEAQEAALARRKEYLHELQQQAEQERQRKLKDRGVGQYVPGLAQVQVRVTFLISCAWRWLQVMYETAFFLFRCSKASELLDKKEGEKTVRTKFVAEEVQKEMMYSSNSEQVSKMRWETF